MRIALPLTIALLGAALLAGCGGSADGDPDSAVETAAPPREQRAPAGATAHECGGAGNLRATGLPCPRARAVETAWARTAGCTPAAGASRSGCVPAGGYRCLSVVTAKGVSVSCARPGSSLAFLVER